MIVPPPLLLLVNEAFEVYISPRGSACKTQENICDPKRNILKHNEIFLKPHRRRWKRRYVRPYMDEKRFRCRGILVCFSHSRPALYSAVD